MHFDYLKTESYMDSIEIEDTGKCAIAVTNDLAQTWYMKIYTSLGWSAVTQIGPVKTDTNCIEYSFNLNYFEFEYNGRKLYKIIHDFINDNKKNITQVGLLELEEYDIIEQTIINNWMTK